jgi:hypothetical protein
MLDSAVWTLLGNREANTQHANNIPLYMCVVSCACVCGILRLHIFGIYKRRQRTGLLWKLMEKKKGSFI